MLRMKSDYRIALFAVLLCVFPLFIREYSTDSYTVERVGLEAFGGLLQKNGRLVTAGAFYLFGRFSIGVSGFYYFSFLLSVLSMSLAVYHFWWVLNDFMSKPVAFFFSFFTVFNPFAIEYFLFIEKGGFAFGIFMSVLALKSFVRFLRGERKHLALSYLYLTISAFTYQTLPGLFVVLVVVFIAIYSQNIKDFVINNLLAVSVYGIGSGLNFLYLKFFSDTQRMDGGICFSNLEKILLPFGKITLAFYPLLLAGVFFSCYVFVKKKEGQNFKQIFGLFLRSVYIFLGAFTGTFFPFLFVAPSELWFPFRMIYPIGAVVGGVLIFFCYRGMTSEKAQDANNIEKKKKRYTAVMSLVLLLQLIFFQTVVIGRLINNRADEQLCQEIGMQIEQYEKTTGNEIKQVCIYYDSNLTKRNPGVLKIGDSNVRAFSKTWSDVDHMNVILERNFVEIEPNPQYVTYFLAQNWDSFAVEQLIFEGETLHCCVY